MEEVFLAINTIFFGWFTTAMFRVRVFNPATDEIGHPNVLYFIAPAVMCGANAAMLLVRYI